VSGNSADKEGGGIHDYRGKSTLTNSTVSGNSARSGGGVYCRSYSRTWSNSIVALNDASNDADAYGTYVNNNSLIGVGPTFVRNPSPGADGVGGTGDDDYGDLRLRAGSPAIDGGDDGLAVDADGESLVTDLDGNPRIVGQRVDIGAYEFQKIRGDADEDGEVDLIDFAIMKANWGLADATWPRGGSMVTNGSI